MTKHFLRDLDHLKKQILVLGSMVEVATHKATTALLERRPELATEVIHSDDQIDAREVQVEEECLKVLALNQPVAADLRFVVAVLKVNDDLERIGDLAVNVAQRAEVLGTQPALVVPHEFAAMVAKTRSMLNNALDSLVNLDVQLARKVLADDDVVDEIHRHMFEVFQALMRKDTATIERAMMWISCSRYTERVADHATNIAEDVLFLVEGEIVRHRRLREEKR
jgi:phosphate transport system protein